VINSYGVFLRAGVKNSDFCVAKRIGAPIIPTVLWSAVDGRKSDEAGKQNRTYQPTFFR
jgi:hypothetical protein